MSEKEPGCPPLEAGSAPWLSPLFWNGRAGCWLMVSGLRLSMMSSLFEFPVHLQPFRPSWPFRNVCRALRPRLASSLPLPSFGNRLDSVSSSGDAITPLSPLCCCLGWAISLGSSFALLRRIPWCLLGVAETATATQKSRKPAVIFISCRTYSCQAALHCRI